MQSDGDAVLLRTPEGCVAISCGCCFRAEFGAAEKGGEGMALKILTRAEDMPDGRDPIFILLRPLAFRSELAKLPCNPRRSRNLPCQR